MTSACPSPDLILYNGIFASDHLVPPHLQAVAIGGGEILAVGRDQEICPLAGPETDTIDLENRLVVPGFFDSHIHFYEWAIQRRGLKLEGLTCIEDLAFRVQEAAHKLAPGAWIMGQGWNETDWIESRMPSREILDRAAPDHPVLLWRCDLHLAAVNSAALKMAGIAADTPDPPDGAIERDAKGRPTGILRELAVNLIRDAISPPDSDQLTQAFQESAQALHRRGVTAIHDIRLMGDKDGVRALQTFQKLDQTDRLDLRCWVSLPGHQLDSIIGLGIRSGFGNDRLRIGHVKFFSDGGMGARTAWMIDPYLDAEYGMPLIEMEFLEHQIGLADDAGLSVMVHAVGDRANRELIKIFEAIATKRSITGTPPPAFRHRIEHVQMIRPEDALRIRNLDLALNVTPCNMVLDMNLIDCAVGDKGRWTYPFRMLMDTGAPVMFSSDCPVCDPDPLSGIHAAVTRKRADGTPEGGWHPGSRVTVAESLNAYTSIPAMAHCAEHLGSIAPGKSADLAVLSHNILEIFPSQLMEAGVEMTLFNGKIVHRKF